MRPDQLVASSFASYPPAARRFALEYLPLLQRLPLAVCPSFLDQVQNLDTSFPVERDLLRWQCASLLHLAPERYAALTAPLASLSLSASLQAADWVHAPASFVTELTAHLWSSGQLDQFRLGVRALFAAVPTREDNAHRLVFVLLGQGAQTEGGSALRKLIRNGVLLTGVRSATAFAEIRSALEQHAAKADAPYGSWYVDGGAPRPELVSALPNTTTVSYPGLAKLRERVLERMQVTLASGNGGAEQMRTQLAGTSLHDAGAAEITSDPVLQRFYTELFTKSSGPQIFSTSFVQWTGRELARRAQPHTLLLRYAPRQSHRDMNEMFASEATSVDPQGSLRDAGMGAYYNWLEMSRITAPGRLTFVAWVEGQSVAVVLGANAPVGAVSASPMGIAEMIRNFG